MLPEDQKEDLLSDCNGEWGSLPESLNAGKTRESFQLQCIQLPITETYNRLLPDIGGSVEVGRAFRSGQCSSSVITAFVSTLCLISTIPAWSFSWLHGHRRATNNSWGYLLLTVLAWNLRGWDKTWSVNILLGCGMWFGMQKEKGEWD